MSNSELTKRKNSIQVASFLAIAAWPAGIVLGNIMSKGQDDPGEGLAQVVGLIISVLFISGPACVYLIWRSQGYWRQLNILHKALVIIPLTPFILLFASLAGLYMFEYFYGFFN